MSINALRRDVAWMRRKWAVWERLWFKYWRLGDAWANASADVVRKCRIRYRVDHGVLDIQGGRVDTSPIDVLADALHSTELRSEFDNSRERMEIDRERLDQLPKLVGRLRRECRGDHRGITNGLCLAYRFTAHEDALNEDGKRRDALHDQIRCHGTEDEEIIRNLKYRANEINEKELISQLDNPEIFPIGYPEDIEREVNKTLDIFASIEQKIMSEFATEEYGMDERDWMVKWKNERDKKSSVEFYRNMEKIFGFSISDEI